MLYRLTRTVYHQSLITVFILRRAEQCVIIKTVREKRKQTLCTGRSEQIIVVRASAKRGDDGSVTRYIVRFNAHVWRIYTRTCVWELASCIHRQHTHTRGWTTRSDVRALFVFTRWAALKRKRIGFGTRDDVRGIVEFSIPYNTHSVILYG